MSRTPNSSQIARTATSQQLSAQLVTWIRRSPPGIAILVVYLTVTFVLTHAPLSGTFLDHQNLPGQLKLLDKIYHFASYCGLTFLVLFAFTSVHLGRTPQARLGSARRLLQLCLLVVAYGIFDKATQPLFGRNFELLDMLANVFGIAAGQLLFVMSEATGMRRKLLRTK